MHGVSIGSRLGSLPLISVYWLTSKRELAVDNNVNSINDADFFDDEVAAANSPLEAKMSLEIQLDSSSSIDNEADIRRRVEDALESRRNKTSTEAKGLLLDNQACPDDYYDDLFSEL